MHSILRNLAYPRYGGQEEVLFGHNLIYYISKVEKKDNIFYLDAEAIEYGK